jgi:hypothetical protein
MERHEFDELARTVARSTSRRALLRGLLAALAGTAGIPRAGRAQGCAAVDEKCTELACCPESGAKCDGAVCVCPDGTVLDGGVCATAECAYPGKPCGAGGCCPETGAVCDGAVCACPPGATVDPSTGACAPIPTGCAGLGKPCVEGDCCAESGAVCAGGVCACPDGTAPGADGLTCRSTTAPCAAIGELCETSSDCCPESLAECRDGLCQMAETGVPACAGLGQPCEDEGLPCCQGMDCSDGVCRCDEKHAPRWWAGACAPRCAHPGEACDADVSCCKGSGTTCQNGTCACPAGFRPCGARCVEDSPYAFDAENCGKPGERCGAGQSCCAGSCIPKADLQADEGHCGKCCTACREGELCCDGACTTDRFLDGSRVDPETDAYGLIACCPAGRLCRSADGNPAKDVCCHEDEICLVNGCCFAHEKCGDRCCREVESPPCALCGGLWSPCDDDAAVCEGIVCGDDGCASAAVICPCELDGTCPAAEATERAGPGSAYKRGIHALPSLSGRPIWCRI